MDSFLTLNKLTQQVFENSKILQNFGIKIESHQSWPARWYVVRDFAQTKTISSEYPDSGPAQFPVEILHRLANKVR